MIGSMGVAVMVAAALGAASGPTPGDGAGADALRTRAYGRGERVDSLRVAESLRRARAFAAAGRMAEMRREYRSLISAERADGEYPATAMWLLANAYFADDNLLATAQTLNAMADAANQVVDPATELRARFEATVLWARLGNREQAQAGLARVDVLLRSPAISDAQRAEVHRRMGR